MHMRRFTRATNGFSKKMENHWLAIALHFVYYNFAKVHKTLRVTPAMEAGLAKKPMTPFFLELSLFKTVLNRLRNYGNGCPSISLEIPYPGPGNGVFTRGLIFRCAKFIIILALSRISKSTGKPLLLNNPKMSITRTPLKNVTTVTEFIKINFSRKEASMRIHVASFIDHDHHVAYVPSLKLSGYGATKEEAMEMLFQDVINDMFDNLLVLGESGVSKELAKYGWHKSLIPNKKYYNDLPYVDPNGILENFNLPEDTSIEVKMMEVA